MPEWFKTWWPIVIAVVPALWVAFTYFDKRRREDRAKAAGTAAKPATPTASATGGGVAAGRDMKGNIIFTNSGEGEPKP